MIIAPWLKFCVQQHSIYLFSLSFRSFRIVTARKSSGSGASTARVPKLWPKLCTKVLELPQFCAAALGMKQYLGFFFCSNRDRHPFFLLLPPPLKGYDLSFVLPPGHYPYPCTRTVCARTKKKKKEKKHVRSQPILLETTVHFIQSEGDNNFNINKVS